METLLSVSTSTRVSNRKSATSNVLIVRLVLPERVVQSTVMEAGLTGTIVSLLERLPACLDTMRSSNLPKMMACHASMKKTMKRSKCAKLKRLSNLHAN